MQTGFAAALLNPDLAVPQGICDPMGRPAPRRFAVYRNNVASGLTRSLEAGFPVLGKLVGAEFFAAMAQVYWRAHPPTSRLMMLYGDDMPAFLEGFPPVAHLGYLPDVARLEVAMRQSYHAADAGVADLSGMAALPPEAVLECRLTLQPGLRVLRSRWPVLSIWRAQAEGGPAPVMHPEEVAVIRTGFDPRPHLLPPGGAAFLQALAAGQAVGAAMEAADCADPPAVLRVLAETGAIEKVTI